MDNTVFCDIADKNKPLFRDEKWRLKYTRVVIWQPEGGGELATLATKLKGKFAPILFTTRKHSLVDFRVT